MYINQVNLPRYMKTKLTHPTAEINVLILVEDEAEAFLITDSLDAAKDCNYQAYHTGSIKDGKSLLRELPIDVVLLDLNLPDSYGSHSITELFEDFSEIPFIILTEINDASIAQNSVLSGAQDFLQKDRIDSLMLSKSINYSIQRKKSEKRLLTAIIETEDTVRKRIAIDLHDGLGQNLSSASINLQSLNNDVLEWPPEKRDVFNLVLKLLQDSIAETRGMARNLMPKAVEEFGLVASIDSMLNTLECSGINFYFYDNLSGSRLPINVEIMLYRVVQESINNILKYANAENVSIHLIKHNRSTVLMIEDNGVGFDINSAKSTNGVGLASIKNRVNSLMGNLTIDSEIGEGTTITIEIPKHS